MSSTCTRSLQLIVSGTCLLAIIIPLSVTNAQSSSTSSEFPETLVMPENIPATTPPPPSAIPPSVFSNRTQARITNLSANMSTRMENTILRFEQIIDRLEKRTLLIKATGANTTRAEAELQLGKIKLASAKTTITDIDAKVRSTVMASDLGGAWPTLRATYTTTRDQLVATHTSLLTTVTLLKEASTNASGPTGPENFTASTTINTPLSQ